MKRADQPMTLEQLSRALAAHALISANPEILRHFFAPEAFDQTADLIYRYSMGEPLGRPSPVED